MKEAFSVKLQTGNICFCSRLKLNKAQAAQMRNVMQSLNIFIGISGPVSEVKKSLLINIGKISLHIGPEQSEVKKQSKVWFVPDKVRGLGGTTMRKILQFSLSFKLGKFISLGSLICCTNMKIYFSWKLAI